jgi:NTE family protein
MPLPDEVGLVLQGGGALGSYQAGVIEALEKNSIDIDWVAGISIGAINAAIVAGNPSGKRVARLRDFWEGVTSENVLMPQLPGDAIREWEHLGAAMAVTAFGVPGFFAPRYSMSAFSAPGSAAATSLYDTTPLAATLDSLVDWDLLNDGPVRLSIGAVDVETGNFRYFDTAERGCRIDARHVMASGALPPGFPAIEIDGKHYWDGGLVSNTPLSHVIDHQREDMLVFQVDLFPATGDLPHNLTDVWSREKDIRYSSRTRQVTDMLVRERKEHRAIGRVLAKLPPEMADDPDVKALAKIAGGRAVSIVHLIYRSHAWEGGARDFEFSRRTMLEHWKQGHEAIDMSVKNGQLLAKNIVDRRVAAFDLAPQPAAKTADHERT